MNLKGIQKNSLQPSFNVKDMSYKSPPVSATSMFTVAEHTSYLALVYQVSGKHTVTWLKSVIHDNSCNNITNMSHD